MENIPCIREDKSDKALEKQYIKALLKRQNSKEDQISTTTDHSKNERSKKYGIKRLTANKLMKSQSH